MEAWDWLRSPRHHLVVEAEHFAHPLLKPSSPSEGLQDKLGTGWHTRHSGAKLKQGVIDLRRGGCKERSLLPGGFLRPCLASFEGAGLGVETGVSELVP